MSNPLKITVRGDNRIDDLRRAANQYLAEDYRTGRLDPMIQAAITSKDQIDPFVDGLERGMAYAWSLALDGKVDLRMITVGSG